MDRRIAYISSKITACICVCIALTPVAVAAQGRILVRPCAPPCGLIADCSRARPAACGAAVSRISSVTNVTLADRVLRYEVVEVFRNSGNMIAEADYIFPLPVGAAFDDLKLSINGELVSGETMGADQARGIYEDIVRRQRDPALVEWMGSGMLRARIFPIQPGEEKKVVVRFQSMAVREGDAIRIDYRRGTDPSSGRIIAPLAQRASNRRGEEESNETWSKFTLTYPRSDDYGTAYSPTHTLRRVDVGNRRRVEARGVAGDVTVLLPVRITNRASMSVLTHSQHGERGFALIAVTPPATGTATTPRDVTFVLDVSGSMQGTKLAQAKAAGDALLKTLRPFDRFRIVDFSTDVRSFRDGWSPATTGELRAARSYLSLLRAEGSTNISEALRVALEVDRSAGRLPLVVFVTDGEPTVGERNPDAIAAIASTLRGDARVFAVGVSTGVNAALIEQLAIQGRGTAHFVRDDESVESTVSLLASRLAVPVLTNVRVVANGVRLSQVMPNGPIDVFAGQDLLVLARYDGSGDATVRLEGQSPTGRVTWSTRARFSESERGNPFIARLWAAQRLGWLAAEKRRAVGAGGGSGGAREIDEEIRALGERYGLPTEFSSYLVVEPGMQIAAQSSLRDRSSIGSAIAGGIANTNAAAASSIGSRKTTASDAARAAPPSPAPAQMRFEAARVSAERRSAKTLQALEEEGPSNENVREVDNRRFVRDNGVWVDVKHDSSNRVVRVKPFTPLYFELMRRVPAFQTIFALGDRIIASGKRVSIELTESGSERADEVLLAGIVRDW